MAEGKIVQLAHTLVHHSTRLNPGENLYLLTNSHVSQSLFDEVARQAVQAGANVFEHIVTTEFERNFLLHATDAQMAARAEAEFEEMQKMDAYIRIGAETNSSHSADVPPERIGVFRSAEKAFLNERMKKKWVVTRYPTVGFASDARMSLEAFAEMFWDAVDRDWPALSKDMDRYLGLFDDKELRIVAPNTDLKMSLKGRPGYKWDGLHNMPDGEISYAPEMSSVNGTLAFTYPSNREGNVVDGVVLRFKEGVVVDAKASQGQSFLEHMLNTDEGARRIGELGIGLNPGITRYINNLLFDEKIKGTLHFALGRPYEQNAGQYESAIHWDLVLDLRKGGTVFGDGKEIMIDGKYVID